MQCALHTPRHRNGSCALSNVPAMFQLRPQLCLWAWEPKARPAVPEGQKARPAVPMALEVLAILPISGALWSNERELRYGLPRGLSLVIRSYTLQEQFLFKYLRQGRRRVVYEGTDMDWCLKLHPIDFDDIDKELALSPLLEPWVLPLFWTGRMTILGATYKVALQHRALTADRALLTFFGVELRVTPEAVEELMTFLKAVLMLVVHCAASGVRLTFAGLEDLAYLGTVRAHQFSETFRLCMWRWKDCTVVQDGRLPRRREINSCVRQALAGVWAACQHLQALF